MFSWTIVASCVAGTMPITHNVDIKLSFEMFDMTPGQSGRAFRRSLLLPSAIGGSELLSCSRLDKIKPMRL